MEGTARVSWERHQPQANAPPAGGEMLFVEASVVPGKGRNELIRRLGDAMKEAVTAALTDPCFRADELGLPKRFPNKYDVPDVPVGEPIEVTVGRPEEGLVRIAVRDHGIGIPLERRAALFDRFYQAHPEGHYGGMGPGLHISREIVALHGGAIEAEFRRTAGPASR